MRYLPKKRIAFLLAAVLLTAVLPVSVCAQDENQSEEKDVIMFMSYEEAVACYDFDKPAYNWCINFGWDPETRLEEAKTAILAGTNRQLVIALATYFRDTGHLNEPIVISNAFRPACYQEVIGLHDSNGNVGPYRKAMTFNGRSVTDFWWSAEESDGWPKNCTIDLSKYDIDTFDLRYFYRECLRMWDNGWVSAYYAKPGCSTHNSGCAMDVQNYWIATNFATSYTYNGKTYAMEDYGLYKPLQPQNGSAGEEWHITCTPAVLALGNYDLALQEDFEIVYCLYYNPVSRGWTMEQGRGVYLGAGVVVLQIALYRLGMLDKEYITGYYCSETEKAVILFQEKNNLGADGICGSGTMKELLAQSAPVQKKDDKAPTLLSALLLSENSKGFTVSISGKDETELNAFRVDTRLEGEDVWVCRYYCAPKSGQDILDVDIWEQGSYEILVYACDAEGNESTPIAVGNAFVDTQDPVLKSIVVTDMTENSLCIEAIAEDNGQVKEFLFTLTDAAGNEINETVPADGNGKAKVALKDVPDGEWSVAMLVSDAHGNMTAHTLSWAYSAGKPQVLASARWFAPSEPQTP